MDDQLKQRLVGASVLIALAVIFLPMIFEGPEEYFDPNRSNIPSRPLGLGSGKIELLELPAPILPESEPVSVDEIPEVAETPKEQPVNVPTPVMQSAVTKNDKNNSWVVQLASFSQEKNAIVLRDRLRKKGYTSFVEPVETKKGKMYRVCIGPELRRSKADALRDELQKETKLEGMVLSHQ